MCARIQTCSSLYAHNFKHVHPYAHTFIYIYVYQKMYMHTYVFIPNCARIHICFSLFAITCVHTYVFKIHRLYWLILCCSTTLVCEITHIYISCNKIHCKIHKNARAMCYMHGLQFTVQSHKTYSIQCTYNCSMNVRIHH